MNQADLADIYRGYIACLNRQDWSNLDQFIHDDVHHNDRLIGRCWRRISWKYLTSISTFGYSYPIHLILHAGWTSTVRQGASSLDFR